MDLIFIAGLGSTGSSAICDFLDEQDYVYSPKEEWRIWVDPYCIIDLIKNLVNNNSIFTINESLNNFNKTMRSISNSSIGKYSHLKLKSDHSRCINDIRDQITKKIISEEYYGLWYGNSNFFNAKFNFFLREYYGKIK